MGTTPLQHANGDKNQNTSWRVSECSQRARRDAFVLPVRPSIYNDFSYTALILYNFILGACEGPEKGCVDVSYGHNIAGIKPNSIYFTKVHNFQYNTSPAIHVLMGCTIRNFHKRSTD
jgi:hypothetical protein